MTAKEIPVSAKWRVNYIAGNLLQKSSFFYSNSFNNFGIFNNNKFEYSKKNYN